MILFVLNLVSISMVAMATIFLVILREKNGTRLIMAGMFIEALMAGLSMLFEEPNTVSSSFILFRFFGRTVEGLMMWAVILLQVKGMLDIAPGQPSPDVKAFVEKKLSTLEESLTDLSHKVEGKSN